MAFPRKKAKYPEVSRREDRSQQGDLSVRFSFLTRSFFLCLSSLFQQSINGKYTYDLLVIGGGSGGLAASKAAAAAVPGRQRKNKHTNPVTPFFAFLPCRSSFPSLYVLFLLL